MIQTRNSVTSVGSVGSLGEWLQRIGSFHSGARRKDKAEGRPTHGEVVPREARTLGYHHVMHRTPPFIRTQQWRLFTDAQLNQVKISAF